MLSAVRHCSFSARLDCHYQLRGPERPDGCTLLVVALHGFSSNADLMLRLTANMFGPQHAIAALQGPNQFFLGANAGEVGYGWNTNRHPAESIRLHHDMVLHVLEEAGRELGIPAERRLLLGFSQPVSLNYRFAAAFPLAVRGVIALCGGLPGDWDEHCDRPIPASVLHIARREDEYYPPNVTARYPERLSLRVLDAEFHLIDGGHRFPSAGSAIAEGWLNRILP
jgi:predicted esterase